MSGYLTGSIAAVALVSGSNNCKSHLLDRGNLLSNLAGFTQIAANGTDSNTQLSNTPVGAKFGIQCFKIPKTVLDSITAAVDTAMNGSGSFLVDVEDEIGTVNYLCIPDFNTQWITIEPLQRTDQRGIKNVTFRFIVVGAAP